LTSTNGVASRLSESLETALNLSAGLVRIASLDADSTQEELVFAAKFSCTKCGYSLTELEPRLFSFNNPVSHKVVRPKVKFDKSKH
jgi:excinuclease ABC subunit A